MTFTPTTIDTVKADMTLVPGDEAFLWLSGVEDNNGQSWCHWCNVAKPDIQRVFGADDKYTLVLEVKQGELLTTPYDWLCNSLRVFGVPGVYRFSRDAAPVAGWEEVPLQPCWEMARYQVEGGYDTYLPAWAAGGEEFERYLKEARGEEYKTPDQRRLDLDMDWDDASRFREHLQAEKEKEKFEAVAKQKEEREKREEREKEELAAKLRARATRRAANSNKENKSVRVRMTRSKTARGGKLNVLCDGTNCSPAVPNK